jgi:hypothetical protein
VFLGGHVSSFLTLRTDFEKHPGMVGAIIAPQTGAP